MRRLFLLALLLTACSGPPADTDAGGTPVPVCYGGEPSCPGALTPFCIASGGGGSVAQSGSCFDEDGMFDDGEPAQCWASPITGEPFVPSCLALDAGL